MGLAGGAEGTEAGHVVGWLGDAAAFQSYIFATCPPLGATDHNTTWPSAMTKSPISNM